MERRDKDERGRFVAGNQAAAGRGADSKWRLDLMREVVTEDDWVEIIVEAVKLAKKGSDNARSFLASYLLGRPVQQDEGEDRTQLAEVMQRIEGLMKQQRRPAGSATAEEEAATPLVG